MLAQGPPPGQKPPALCTQQALNMYFLAIGIQLSEGGQSGCQGHLDQGARSLAPGGQQARAVQGPLWLCPAEAMLCVLRGHRAGRELHRTSPAWLKEQRAPPLQAPSAQLSLVFEEDWAGGAKNPPCLLLVGPCAGPPAVSSPLHPRAAGSVEGRPSPPAPPRVLRPSAITVETRWGPGLRRGPRWPAARPRGCSPSRPAGYSS